MEATIVKAIITIGDHEDSVLNLVNGKQGLKSQSKAICLIIGKYEEGKLGEEKANEED